MDDYVDDSTEVSYDFSGGIKLENAFASILEQHELVVTIKNEILTVTSVDQAIEWRETRVYPMDNSWPTDVDSIAQVITDNVDTDAWDSSADCVSTLENALVITTNEINHRKIEKLIAQLDRHWSKER